MNGEARERAGHEATQETDKGYEIPVPTKNASCGSSRRSRSRSRSRAVVRKGLDRFYYFMAALCVFLLAAGIFDWVKGARTWLLIGASLGIVSCALSIRRWRRL